ncbi:MAG: hypothetical protein JW748_01330 [Anaerolineales bacterium]|nr:hypothetical protein [Anaerolineales bacterium]
MGCAKTVSVILSAVLATIAALLLSYFFFSASPAYLFRSQDSAIQVFVHLAAALVIAAAYGVTIYLLLVWNAGGKLAAAGVLIFGLMGELIFLIVLQNGPRLIETIFWAVCTSSTSHLFNGLNIAFGLAGFFTKRRIG